MKDGVRGRRKAKEKRGRKKENGNEGRRKMELEIEGEQ